MGPRLEVRKTYKLYIGGAFVRSESGRTYEVTAADGAFVANMAQASRKDVRDAVEAARGAAAGWAARSGYNRGQILYRVAEMLEARRDQLAADVAAGGVALEDARTEVDAAVDRWVWYAGWTDKVAQVLGSMNPVAGPYFNVSTPEPTGVVGVLAPRNSALLGLVSVIAPALAGGNTVVVVAAQDRPVPAATLTEVLATSDVPPGVVNVLTGVSEEVAPVLAAHRDVAALDLVGASDEQRAELERAAADHTARLVVAADGAWTDPPSTARLRGALEIKTVWHPAGL